MKAKLQGELENIDRALEKLQAIGGELGKTEDQTKLLTAIEADLEKYRNLVNKHLADDNISESEKVKLLNAREDIFEHAKMIAAEDNRYNEDEWVVLRELLNFTQSKQIGM